jgi:hypothetical protein
MDICSVGFLLTDGLFSESVNLFAILRSQPFLLSSDISDFSQRCNVRMFKIYN